MSRREAVYALFAIVGLIGTWIFNAQYAVQTDGFDPVEWLRLGFVNPAAASLTIDVLVAFAVFIVWALAESRRIGMRHGWLYPVLGLLVAFAFAFPLFLLLRERYLRTMSSLEPSAPKPLPSLPP